LTWGKDRSIFTMATGKVSALASLRRWASGLREAEGLLGTARLFLEERNSQTEREAWRKDLKPRKIWK